MAPTFAIAATLRESREDTLAFVRYHVRLGTDHLYLFFDDTRDPTIAELADLPGVTCIGCDEAHWSALTGKSLADFNARQIMNTELALDFCRSANIDWLIPIDADELVYGNQDVRAYLASVPDTVDVVWVPPLEAVHVRGNVLRGPFAATHYKVAPTGWNRKVARRAYAPIKKYGRDGFLAHAIGKSFLRTSVRYEGIGVHGPSCDTAWREAQAAAELLILHHDAMQFPTWKRKWQWRGQSGLHFRMGPGRKAQAAEFARLHEQDKSHELRRLFVLTKTLPKTKIDRLKKHDLLREIPIDRALFESPLPSEMATTYKIDAPVPRRRVAGD